MEAHVVDGCEVPPRIEAAGEADLELAAQALAVGVPQQELRQRHAPGIPHRVG